MQIFVLSDDYGVNQYGVAPHSPVVGCGQATVHDVLGGLLTLTEPACERRWELGIHQEAHETTRSTGWSVCFAANSRTTVMSCGSRYG